MDGKIPVDSGGAKYYVMHSSSPARCGVVGVVASKTEKLNAGTMQDFIDNWSVQVRKGLLEYCILSALSERERYGYELVKTLVQVLGLSMTEGTVYPILSRLRVQGLVETRLEESSEGPARKYYSLTRDGRRVLLLMQEYLDKLNAGAQALREKGAKR
jgi:PadR family transcriptional regulator PadR